MKIKPSFIESFNEYKLKLKIILSEHRKDGGKELNFHGVERKNGIPGILVIGNDTDSGSSFSKFYGLSEIDKLFENFTNKIDVI